MVADLVTASTIVSCVLALCVVATSAIGVDPIWLWLFGIVAAPFVLLLTVLVLIPVLKVRIGVRALALVSVLVMVTVVITGWPLRIMFTAHRSALTEYIERVRSGEITAGVGRKQIGAVPVFEVRVTTDGSVGLQTTRWYGGGIWLVHTIPGSSVYGFNTNWEQNLGGGWYRVYED